MSSPGARVETAGTAARNGSAWKRWLWLVRSQVDEDGPYTAPYTWPSCVPPSRQGPCRDGLGEGVLRSGASRGEYEPLYERVGGA